MSGNFIKFHFSGVCLLHNVRPASCKYFERAASFGFTRRHARFIKTCRSEGFFAAFCPIPGIFPTFSFVGVSVCMANRREKFAPNCPIYNKPVYITVFFLFLQKGAALRKSEKLDRQIHISLHSFRKRNYMFYNL